MLSRFAASTVNTGSSFGRLFALSVSKYCTKSVEMAEKEIEEKLKKAFDVRKVEVQDTSGGCGQMYHIEIEAEDFRGKSMLKQQQLVNAALKEEIKTWHAITMKTYPPKT